MRLLSPGSAVVMFFVITGVPIALLTYMSIDLSTESAVHQAQKAEAGSAAASAVFIRQLFENVADQLSSFAGSDLSSTMDVSPPAQPDQRTIGDQLNRLVSARSGISTAFVTDPRGELIAIEPQRVDLLGRYFTGDDWYQGVSSPARAGAPYVAGLSATAAQQDLNSVAIAAVIPGRGGTGAPARVGYIVGIYSLDQIQRFVDDFSKTHGTDLTIVDREGYLLAAPGLTPGTVASWRDDDLLLKGALAGRSGVSQVGVGGPERLAAYAPVQGFGWAVVAAVPANAALHDADQLRFTVLVIASILGLMLIGGLIVGQTLVHRAQQSAVFESRMHSLARLHEAARSVHTERGPRALEIITASARDQVGADFGVLAVRDPVTGRVESVAHDASPDLPVHRLTGLAALLAQRCWQTMSPERGDLRELLPVATADAAPPELGPLISVPLSAGERVLGCLTVGRRAGRAPFNAINEGQLRQMAQHATTVLEKARHDGEREAFLQRLSETNEELERANRLKSQFLATMSHELRTPLSAIIGFSDLLLEGASGVLDQEQEQDVREISRAGRVLLEVINDILDLTRIEAGRVRLEMRPIRLGPLLADVVSALRPLALDRALELNVEIAGPDVPVLADPLRVRQVVTNLVSNSLKFTQRGGVSIRLRPAGDQVEVAVHDTGIGIPKEALDSVFDEFTQVDGGTKREFGGSGLGLSIARRLVHLHGGTIGVESVVGVGSRFWFRLSKARTPASPAPVERAVAR